MEEENINIPLSAWIEPNTDKGRSQEDTVSVAFDNFWVNVKPGASIKTLGDESWYKEIVFTYTRKRTSSSKFTLTFGQRLENATPWVNTVWNYMAKHYNAYLKNINTEKRTLRFSVLTEEDFKRLERKAARFPKELQKDMLKDTGIWLEGFGLQAKSKSTVFSDSTYIDSGLDTDSITNITFGRDMLSILKEVKIDLNDIKRSISKLQSGINRRYRRRCCWSHSIDKLARGLSPNRSCKSSLTSTDEENVLPMDKTVDIFSDKDSGLYIDDCITNSNRSSSYSPSSYGSVESRSNDQIKPRLTRFRVQKNPSLQVNRHGRATLHLQQREKENNASDDGYFDSTFGYQSTTKKKQELGHGKRKTKISGRLDVPPRGPDFSVRMVPRGSVKVLKPRQMVEEKWHLARDNSTESETQYMVLESTVKRKNNGIGQNKLLHQITTQQTMQIGKRQQNNDISSQGHSQQHTIHKDERQGYNAIFSQGHSQQHTMHKDEHHGYNTITSQQQQLQNTESHKSNDEKSLDDQLLIEKTISEMEQRGELDLETDGIVDPNILSTILNGETEKTEKAEDVKTEELQTVETEKKVQGGEQEDNSTKNRHSDTLSEGNRCQPWQGQELANSAGTEDDMYCNNEISDNVSTVTSEVTGSSLESCDHRYSLLPDVDTKTMLQRVGLDTSGTLVQILNQNKKCIEDSSHEAKGNGIDTVLLVDASSSMDDKSFWQMKSACLNIVEFIETLAAEKGIEENLALVVFGRNPMILQHLTIDYRKLYDKIENIELGGSSPLCIGTLLCMLELHLRGGTTSISRYQIPPRVIVMTDGRPTDDIMYHHQDIEFGVKSPTVKENVLRAMDEMRHHGYEMVFVPTGQAINRIFLADMAERAGGCIAELDDLSNVKKHFLHHHTIAKVIGICRDTDFEDLFKDVMDNETAALLSSTWSDTPFTEADVKMMKTELEKSEELNDIEHPDLHLPPIGSRVSIPAAPQSSYSTLSKHYGTVIQQKSTGTIKVEWDAGMISFLDWSEDIKKLGICNVKEPRQLAQGSLIDVGVAVTKAHTVAGLPVQGRVFLTTNNGYVKVRWDDGTVGRHKYGADATFDLHIALESYSPDSYVWQYKADDGCWVTYPPEDLSRIENELIKRSKTVITNSGRIVFDKMIETLTRGECKRRHVRRITVAETTA